MSISTEERLSLSDPDAFQDHDRIHDIFTRMRAEEPVAWCPEPWGGPGFWSITKYDDIQYVSKNPMSFGSDQKLGGITLPSNEMIRNKMQKQNRKALEEPSSELRQFEGGSNMIAMDPPEHIHHRKVVAPGFTANTLNGLTPRIRELSREILGRLEGKDEVEFISAVAAELPIQMLAELFGLDQEVRHKLFEWSNIIIGGDDPDIVVSPEQSRTAFMELAVFAMELHAKRKENPGDDLISMLVHSEVNGEPVSMADYLSSMVLLVVAGNETTRNSISGGVLALSENPAEKQKLIDDPSLIPGAVDEIIRWSHPVIYMRRTATEDAKVGDQKIKKGDKLALWYMSGNRDEEKWDDPFTFDVTRKGPRHLSFGYAQHLCIGWRLAEMQLEILLEELLPKFPDIKVTGEVNRMRTNFLNSIKTMQVSL